MHPKTQITADDILPLAHYAAERKALRAALVAQKRTRRLAVGPDCTFYFENFETMRAQVQEMLFIEKGGAEQLAEELAAYNPLIPQGDELVATIMFEIDNPVRRQAFLQTVGGIEHSAFIELGGEIIKGEAEEDLDRTSAAGKASAVQFVHFPFSARQKALFCDGKTPVFVGFTHPAYAHRAQLPEAMRLALSLDFT